MKVNPANQAYYINIDEITEDNFFCFVLCKFFSLLKYINHSSFS